MWSAHEDDLKMADVHPMLDDAYDSAEPVDSCLLHSPFGRCRLVINCTVLIVFPRLSLPFTFPWEYGTCAHAAGSFFDSAQLATLRNIMAWFPPETLAAIFKWVFYHSSGKHESRKSVLSCLQACRFWRPIAEETLYNMIDFCAPNDCPHHGAEVGLLFRTLRNNPILTSYVKEINAYMVTRNSSAHIIKDHYSLYKSVAAFPTSQLWFLQ